MGFFKNLGSRLGGAADTGVDTVGSAAQTGVAAVGGAAQDFGKGAINVATLGEYNRSREMKENYEQLTERLENIAKSTEELADGRDEHKIEREKIEVAEADLSPDQETASFELADRVAEIHGPTELGKHMVQEGDSLSKIAQDKGMDVSELIDLNPELDDPNVIMPGQEINVGEMTPEKGLSDKLAQAQPEPAAPAAPEADQMEV